MLVDKTRHKPVLKFIDVKINGDKVGKVHDLKFKMKPDENERGS